MHLAESVCAAMPCGVNFRKVWVSIKFLSPRKRDQKCGTTVQIIRKSSRLTLFRGGERSFAKWIYRHLGVSENCWSISKMRLGEAAVHFLCVASRLAIFKACRLFRCWTSWIICTNCKCICWASPAIWSCTMFDHDLRVLCSNCNFSKQAWWAAMLSRVASVRRYWTSGTGSLPVVA